MQGQCGRCRASLISIPAFAILASVKLIWVSMHVFVNSSGIHQPFSNLDEEEGMACVINQARSTRRLSEFLCSAKSHVPKVGECFPSF